MPTRRAPSGLVLLAVLVALLAGVGAPGHAHASEPTLVRLRAALAVVSPAAVAYTSSQSGAWNDPLTWGGTGVPSADDDVIVAAEHTVDITEGDDAGTLRVEAGATLQPRRDNGSPWFVLTVSGNVVNHGTVRLDNPASYGNTRLLLDVGGDITSDGTWDPLETRLTGAMAQRITASTPLGGLWTDTDPAAAVLAGSDLTFDGALRLQGSDLDLGARRLAFTATTPTEAGGLVLDGGTVRSEGGLLSLPGGGGAMLRNVRIEGAVTLEGTLAVEDGLTLSGPLTVAPGAVVLPTGGSNGYVRVLAVEGAVVNHGALQIYNGYDYATLVLSVGGDVTSDGTWTAPTNLVGTADQAVTASTPLGGLWTDTEPASAVVAGSDLVFDGALRLQGSDLDLGARRLAFTATTPTEAGGLVLDGGTVRSEGGLLSLPGGGGAMLRNVRIEGAVTLEGTLAVEDGLTLSGPLTVAPGAVVLPTGGSNGYVRVLAVEGAVVNHGALQIYNGYDYATLVLSVGGDVTNDGTWTADTRLVGPGRHDVIGVAPITGPFVLDDFVTGRLGRVVFPRAVPPTGGSFEAIGARFVLDGGTGLDSLAIETVGNEAPATYGNAVLRTWALRPSPAAAEAVLSQLVLRYGPDLGPNDEATLEVYRSEDDGQTWVRVSTSTNTVRDAAANTVTLSGAPASGTYALSSQADPISVRPNVVFSIIGTDRIRVGPPNRYSLTYLNAGPTPTGDFAIGLTTAGGIYIASVTPSPAAPGIEPRLLLPADFSHTGDSTHAVLYVPSLRPGEERTMTADLRTRSDIGLTTGGAAGRGGASLSAEGSGGPLVNLAGAVTKGGAESYLKDVWKATLIELAEHPEDASHAPNRAFDRVNNDWFGGVEKGAGAVTGSLAGEAATLASRGNAFQLDSAIKEVADLIQDILDADARRDERWRRAAEGAPLGPDGGPFTGIRIPIPPVELPSAPPKTPQPVRSWDPNEKLGPQGVGDEGFVASLGRAHFTIKFENLAAATAPAYEVVIVDTLSAAFDAASVEFGATSWDGFVMERVGNVLRWRATGIELPPNVAPPEGEGFVEFTVDVVPGLADGAALDNHATIWFDINPPIVTNTHRNTLDHSAPATVMAALPDESTGPEITVRWAASDLDPSGAPGAGVQTATLFVSRDGGPFLAAATTEAGEATVPGAFGSTYAFYALSADAVGNAEVARPAVVQTRLVEATGTTPSSTGVFALAPPAPNPVGQTTRLRYSLARSAEASLVAYDILGRQVSVLASGEQAAGAHQVLWDATGLASGVYLLHLTQGDEVAVQRVLVVR